MINDFSNEENTQLSESIGGYSMFQRRALQSNRDELWRLGFSNGHRSGDVRMLAQNIQFDLQRWASTSPGGIFLDVGSGASSLSIEMLKWSREHSIRYVSVDSEEMNSYWPGELLVESYNGRFPDVCSLLAGNEIRPNIIFAYSVIHYAKKDRILQGFVESALALLADGGVLYLGDVPSKAMKITQAKIDRRKPLNLSNCITKRDMRLLTRLSVKNNASLFMVPQPAVLLLSPHRLDIVIRKHRPQSDRGSI